MKEYLQVTERDLRNVSKRHGSGKIKAIAALIKGQNFMARLNSAALHSETKPLAVVLRNPQGQLPAEVHEKDLEVRIDQ